MPEFTITITDKVVDRLNILVQRANEANGTRLTLGEWLQLHTEEMAIADQLAARIQALQEEGLQAAQDALSAAIRVERERLLADIR